MIPGLEPIPVTRPLPIGACLKWVVGQPRWLRTTLIGGLWVLASLTVVGLPVLLGYYVRVVRAGFTESSLPAWDHGGEMYREGLGIAAVWLAHWGPVGLAIWAASRAAALQDAVRTSELTAFLLVVTGPLAALAWSFYVNSALLRVVVLRDLRAAMDVGEVADFTRRNLSNFGRLLVLLLPANGIAQASCCLAGIGLFPGSFWLACTFNYALGQIGRCDTSLPREASPPPETIAF